MKAKPLYSIKTFGCKVNTYDSALIHQQVTHRAQGTTPIPDGDNDMPIHIINTCAVTESAVKSALHYIRQYKTKHPESRIVVTGCATQVETEKWSHLPEVDLIVANSHKAELAHIINNQFFNKPNLKNKPQLPKVFKSSIFKKQSLGQGGTLEKGRTRFFLKIQDGCDSFCTFCIIPFARGKSRSIPIPDLIRSVQEHYDQGVREVVLTGVHIGDYKNGQDQKDLSHLLCALLKQTKMPRIRLSSLEPIELSPKLLELWTNPRVCPHFHLSIQSANSEILKKMKRKYQAKDVEKTLKDIDKKIPSAFVGMDIIAGFAGESQKQFEDTYLKLKNWPWTKLHVFPYSPRRYTYAERAYESHPRSLIIKRASLLRHLSETRFKSSLRAQIGTVKKVLPLKHKAHTGLSRDYWTVFLDQNGSMQKEVFPSSGPDVKHEFSNHLRINTEGEIQITVQSVDEQNKGLYPKNPTGTTNIIRT